MAICIDRALPTLYIQPPKSLISEELDTQTAYNSFSDVFESLYNLHFPKRTIKFNRNHHNLEPWLTSGLLISRSRKIKLSSIFSKNPTNSNSILYKTYRGVYNLTVRAAKKLYYQTQLQKNYKNLKKNLGAVEKCY